MFILNPDPYLLPAYRISPFRTQDIAFNYNLPFDNSADDYFKDRFAHNDFFYTLNARSAINIALAYYNLQPDDVVTILTTSGNFYISSCVTTEIEKFCKWSRTLENNTKVILVNHEFGYPFENLVKLRKLNIPIIEDCAHSFFSCDIANNIGTIGEFVIFSFPKMFPIQIGGLLVSNIGKDRINIPSIENGNIKYIQKVLSYYLKQKSGIINARIHNYSLLKNNFEKLGFSQRFNFHKGIVPGVFMFKSEVRKINLNELKTYFYKHGIQCSVFYGEEAFFIPCHQNLKVEDIEYFTEVFNHFI
jgi:hypothetical protein